MSETRRSNSRRFRTTGGPELPCEPERSLSAPARHLTASYEGDIINPSSRRHSLPVQKGTTATCGPCDYKPGAFAVRGIGVSEEEDLWSSPSGFDSQRGISLSSVGAVVVSADHEEQEVAKRLRKEKAEMPLAETTAETKPWQRRQLYIVGICMIVLAILIVSITIPMSNHNNSYNDELSPTISPAPTSLALITVVVQLDTKPWETGWTLSCDDGIVEDAPPGTYGIVSERPVFRIEYEAVVHLGADCKLTITDRGGDGLNPGLFEVYLGDVTRIGNPGYRLIGGSVGGSNTTMAFTVDFADASSPFPSPTVAPTVAIQQNTTAACTICPDGGRVLYPETKDENGTTCEELEAFASSLGDMMACKMLRDSAQPLCGCRNYCTTVCPDGMSDIDPANADDIVFIKNNRHVTCSDLQQDVTSSYSNSMDQCGSFAFLGEEVCGCETMGAFCNVCQGGRSLNPPPGSLERMIVPGVSCRDLTGIAYCLRQDDPSGIFARLCPAFQSIGSYCGCEKSGNEQEFCRLCGDSILPEPSRLVDSTILGIRTTCFHVEFASNTNDTSTRECNAYRRDSATECCT